jgi:hypothetical protein
MPPPLTASYRVEVMMYAGFDGPWPAHPKIIRPAR